MDHFETSYVYPPPSVYVTMSSMERYIDDVFFIWTDTTIMINNGNIESDLYTKPTDRNSLLLYTSCHPQHIKKALPKSHDRIK
ncbi:unnamed protein product [Ranitomeya imitator]|uniref:Uncharacterized protein n=1 Tax=Ranitomeya imitator TaxID=111125 RepID=A0ABN9MIB4_9NEOB|nr:unnamed protein product [Ranitomeya imitator]